MVFVLALGVLATGVNAWSLLPNLAYGFDTLVARANRTLPVTDGGVATVHYLLDPFRPTTGGIGRDITVTIQWMALVWAAVAVWLSWRRVAARWLKVMVVGSAMLLCGFLLFATTPGLWAWLPTLFRNTQFTWRLHAYVLLATVLVVMFALRMSDSVPAAATRGWLHVALGAVTAFSLVIGVVQIWHVESRMIVPGFNVPYHGTRADIVASRGVLPVGYYGSDIARDMAPLVVRAAPDRLLRIPPADVVGSTYRGVVLPPNGYAPFHTNIATSERFVDVRGLDVLGRDADGFLVARRARDQAPSGPVALEIVAAASGPIVAGRVLSVASLLGLVVVLSLIHI